MYIIKKNWKFKQEQNIKKYNINIKQKIKKLNI